MKQKIRETEYISLLRWVAIAFIVWAHFEYQVFGLYTGTSLEQKYFFPPAPASYVFYGLTGKYALSVLCLVSGYLMKMQCEKGKIGSFFSFAWKRYVRLLLPITGTGICYIMLDAMTNRNYTWKDIFSGLFLLGSSSFDQHVFAIFYFWIGNLMIVLLYKFFGKKKCCNVLLECMLSGMIVVLVLKRWRFLDSLSVEQILKHQLLLTIYQENLLWIAAALLGATTYTVNQWLSGKTTKKLQWCYFILLIPIYFLPRGEESQMIWVRDILAGMCLITLIEQTKIKNWLNHLSSRRFFQWIMPLSYGMFVTHGIVNTAITQPLTQLLLQKGFTLVPVYLISYTAMVVGVLLMSLFIHSFWEKRR